MNSGSGAPVSPPCPPGMDRTRAAELLLTAVVTLGISCWMGGERVSEAVRPLCSFTLLPPSFPRSCEWIFAAFGHTVYVC